MGLFTGLWRLMFPKKKNNYGLPELIIATVLLLLVSGAVIFGIGINHLSGSTLPSPPQEVKADASFYLLLSQSLVNILTSACTLSGIIRGDGFTMEKDAVKILVPISISVVLSIAAPPAYAATDNVEVGNQTNGMVVSFVSSVFAVLAAVFSSNLVRY